MAQSAVHLVLSGAHHAIGFDAEWMPNMARVLCIEVNISATTLGVHGIQPIIALQTNVLRKRRATVRTKTRDRSSSSAFGKFGISVSELTSAELRN